MILATLAGAAVLTGCGSVPTTPSLPTPIPPTATTDLTTVRPVAAEFARSFVKLRYALDDSLESQLAVITSTVEASVALRAITITTDELKTYSAALGELRVPSEIPEFRDAIQIQKDTALKYSQLYNDLRIAVQTGDSALKSRALDGITRLRNEETNLFNSRVSIVLSRFSITDYEAGFRR